MEEAQFEYKCRRCGNIHRNPCCSVDTAISMLIGASFRDGISNPKTGYGAVYRHGSHRCSDGGHGLTDLIGFRVVE